MRSFPTGLHSGLLLAATLVLGSCSEQERPGIPPKHVLLVTVEALRADRSSAYLYHRDTTGLPPLADENAEVRLTLDYMAEQGVLFTQAFAPTGAPLDSLASILGDSTGLEPGAPQVTLASAFRAAGFDTAGFCATTLPDDLHEGFDVLVEGETDQQMLVGAIEFCNQRDWANGKGAFLWMHFSGAGPPYWPTPREIEGRDFHTLFTDPEYAGEDGQRLAERLAAGESLSAAELEHLGNLYDGELALSTYLLQYFLGFYRFSGNTSGAWPETVAVVCGTHGVELGDRIGVSPWESARDAGLRVPLLFRHPSSLTGRRIFSDLVTLADVGPTLADWFDVEFSSAGRSLLVVTDSYLELDLEERPCVARDATGRASLRTDEWRLVRELDGTLRLFEIQRMQELPQDVAALHPDVAAELDARLTRALADLIGGE